MAQSRFGRRVLTTTSRFGRGMTREPRSTVSSRYLHFWYVSLVLSDDQRPNLLSDTTSRFNSLVSSRLPGRSVTIHHVSTLYVFYLYHLTTTSYSLTTVPLPDLYIYLPSLQRVDSVFKTRRRLEPCLHIPYLVWFSSSHATYRIVF